MNISRWKGDRRRSPPLQPGQMVRVNRAEALRIIQGLCEQLLSGSPNVNRPEFDALVEDEHIEYFSIAVREETQP